MPLKKVNNNNNNPAVYRVSEVNLSGKNIPTASLQRGNTPNKYPRHDMKPSDFKAPALEI